MQMQMQLQERTEEKRREVVVDSVRIGSLGVYTRSCRCVTKQADPVSCAG